MIDGPDPACTGKVRHATKGNALEALRNQKHRIKRRPGSKALHVYRCRKCCSWHLGNF